MRTCFIFVLANFLLTGLYSQVDTTRTIELENLVVQGNRINTLFNESSRNISILTEKNIKSEMKRIVGEHGRISL